MTALTFHFMAENQKNEANKPVAPFEVAAPCPFCTSDNITVTDEDGIIFYCECLSCKAAGPEKGDRYHALKVWNERYKV